MRNSLISGFIGILGIIHTNQVYSPEFNKYKVGQCVADHQDRFYIDEYKENVYTVIYMDGLLAIVKAKIQIDRKLVDKGFYEISCN